MHSQTEDTPVQAAIERLVGEEHALYGRGQLDEAAVARLSAIKVALDQCWDLLRQRRALRDAGLDPERAQVRPASIVEHYES